MRRHMNGESTKAAMAFVARKAFKGKNTEVELYNQDPHGCGLFLHKHCIAVRNEHKVVFCLQGWVSQVTLARLNAICTLLWGEERFRQEKGRIWFGPGFLREVDPKEEITLPLKVTP